MLPRKRVGKPQDLDAALLMLCANESHFINGAVIGGRRLRRLSGRSAACPCVAVLTPLEARVLAVLVEKQATVPDTYPLSLNALVAGCNQKTARDPVMEPARPRCCRHRRPEGALSLVFEGSGSRVTRYEHNCGARAGRARRRPWRCWPC
jgi:hypothetical protein